MIIVANSASFLKSFILVVDINSINLYILGNVLCMKRRRRDKGGIREG